MFDSQTVQRAAGVLIKHEGRYLIANRADGLGWALPGGGIEDGEDALQAAIRECGEEIGFKPEGDLVEFCRRIRDGVDFTTFIFDCAEAPSIVLNDEHTGYMWATADEMRGMKLHPGVLALLTKLTGNELDVARAIRDGELTSPQYMQNMALFAIRITGTGVAYRTKHEEFVWREPSVYLNDEFLARCNGLSVIYEHPKDAILNSEEFGKRIVGTVLLPYIKNDEVWGIAKIYDENTIVEMTENPLSTSPAIVLRGEDQELVQLDDGRKLLIEGKPSLLDHIAICKSGVWDKADAPSGIISEDVKIMNDTVRADSAESEATPAPLTLEGVMSSIQTMFNGMSTSIGAITARLDSMEKDKPEETAADDDDDTPEPKADGEEDREQVQKADEMVALKQTIADMQAKLSTPAKEYDDAEAEELADAQHRADSATAALGEKAIRPMAGEEPLSYKRRVLNKLKAHSPTWKGVDLAKADASVIAIAEQSIFADAMAAADSPLTAPEGTLRMRTQRSAAGHTINTFHGSIGETFAAFKQEPRRVDSIITQ